MSFAQEEQYYHQYISIHDGDDVLYYNYTAMHHSACGIVVYIIYYILLLDY